MGNFLSALFICINVPLTTLEEPTFMTDELLDLEDSLLLDEGDDDRFLLLLPFTEVDKERFLFLASSANSAGANDFTMAFKSLLSDTEDNSVTKGRCAKTTINNLQSQIKKLCKKI